ncbi:tetratricopeptide repeat protein [Sorangium sp. So ce363]|uniref:tetratricopeptide repeat protein n=1 Tax=Sorangium sp. So ce363 TaxID=3133304 RepID=UPI003F621A03
MLASLWRARRRGSCLDALPRAGRSCARLAGVAFALALAVSPGVAFAQAEALLDEGKSLMKKGKVAEACPKLEESYRLSPRSATLLALAMCHEKQGKVATAWSEYIDLGAAARKEGNKRLEADAKARGAKLELSLPRLTLSVPRAAAIEGLEVMLDGAPVDGALWGQARPIDPGQHKVRASAPGRKPWEHSVTIKRGERKTVAVPALAKDASAAAQPAPAAEAPAPAAASAAPEKGSAGSGDGAAGPGKGAAGPGKGAAAAEAGKGAAAPGKGAAGPGKGAAAPGKAAAGPETDAPPAAPAAAEEPEPSAGSSPRHTGSFVIQAGVTGGALIGLMDSGSFGDLSAYSYSYNIPEGELIAPCDDEVCHASFDPAIGPFAGGEAFIGFALSEDLHLGARVLGGYRFGGGYLVVGGPSISMRFGRVWLGLSGLVGPVGQEAKVTGIKGEIPSEVVHLNYGRSEAAVNAREGSLPESALVETLAFGGSVDVSLVLADLPSAGWTSGALLLSVSPTVMKGLDGWVFAAPASLGYRFY